ncbi:MAG: hypothetical protein K0R85_152 [Devosia sp.]|jgi:hypothetical protein|nr:hypothetical protein [Devosia sp.]
MGADMLFGLHAEEITAFATLGTLLAMVIGGIFQARFRHTDKNPKPHVVVDLVDRPNAQKGVYQLSVHNDGKVPFQVTSVNVAPNLPYWFQQDGENVKSLIVKAPSNRILPGQALQMTFTVWRGDGVLRGFELGIYYTRRGTASDREVVSTYVSR